MDGGLDFRALSGEAFATLQAAYIQAEATISAAEIQGDRTLEAGMLAVLAAVIAAGAAYFASTRQVRQNEREARAIADAYRFRMHMISAGAVVHYAVIYYQAKKQLEFWRANGGSQTLEVVPPVIPDDMDSSRWRDHQILGDNAVRSIHGAGVALAEYKAFAEDAQKTRIKTDDMSEIVSLGAEEPLPDGTSQFKIHNAVEQYAKLSEDALNALVRVRDLAAPRRRRFPRIWA